MFNDEELRFIREFMDVRQDRTSVLATIRKIEVDPEIKPEIDSLIVRLEQISDAEFAAIDFDAINMD